MDHFSQSYSEIDNEQSMTLSQKEEVDSPKNGSHFANNYMLTN